MSSEFQATLNSKGMHSVPADVAFGSRVSIRHHNTQGGYLHSHNHMYPTGSKQQQITLYPHKDENNIWTVENQTNPVGGEGISGFDAISPPIWIEDGALIRLYHAPTDRRLHSHDVRPQLPKRNGKMRFQPMGTRDLKVMQMMSSVLRLSSTSLKDPRRKEDSALFRPSSSSFIP